MTRPFILLTFFYLLAFFAHSQEVDRIDKYREDQFYIGFSLAIQDQGIPEFKQNGFSNYFQLGFIRDIPLNSKGNYKNPSGACNPGAIQNLDMSLALLHMS